MFVDDLVVVVSNPVCILPVVVSTNFSVVEASSVAIGGRCVTWVVVILDVEIAPVVLDGTV